MRFYEERPMAAMRLSNPLLLLILLLLPGCIIAPIETPTTPPLSTRDEVRAFVELVNEHRRKVGCKPFTWLTPVAEVAQNHSENMYHYSFFSHVNHEGKSPFERLKEAGIAYRRAAENIAAGQQTAEQVLHSWLGSPGHRRNIDDCSLLQHGVGLANHRWTHMLVTLR